MKVYSLYDYTGEDENESHYTYYATRGEAEKALAQLQAGVRGHFVVTDEDAGGSIDPDFHYGHLCPTLDVELEEWNVVEAPPRATAVALLNGRGLFGPKRLGRWSSTARKMNNRGRYYVTVSPVKEDL